MTDFHQGAVSQIPNTSDRVYAFEVSGHLDPDTSEALAQFMNARFDAHDKKVHLLFDLSKLEDSDGAAILKTDVARSRVRALSHVEKYAVVGAPDAANKMIDAMGAIIPVEARTFAASERDAAWSFVGASPSSTRA